MFMPNKFTIKLDMSARRLFKEHDRWKKWCEEFRGVKIGNYKMGLTDLADENGFYKQLPSSRDDLGKPHQPDEKAK